jgi:hypothetical protein
VIRQLLLSATMQGIPLTSSELGSLTQRQLIHAVLQQSVTTGLFNDTKLWLFSRRRSDGVVDNALPVYANSIMLRAGSAYFDGRECVSLHVDVGGGIK